MKYFEEFDTFFDLAKFIRVILDNFSDLSKVDENDLYELVYIKRKIEQILKSNIHNKIIFTSLKDILEAINYILNSLRDKQFDDIAKHSLKLIHKINKVKYKNKYAFEGYIDINDNNMRAKVSPRRENYNDRIAVVTAIRNNIEVWLKSIAEDEYKKEIEEIERLKRVIKNHKDAIDSIKVNNKYKEVLVALKKNLNTLEDNYTKYTACNVIDLEIDKDNNLIKSKNINIYGNFFDARHTITLPSGRQGEIWIQTNNRIKELLLYLANIRKEFNVATGKMQSTNTLVYLTGLADIELLYEKIKNPVDDYTSMICTQNILAREG